MFVSKRRLHRIHRASAGVLILLSLFSLGCVENAIRQRKEAMDYEPIPVPEVEGGVGGSIFQGQTSSGSYLFFDSKARRVGDLITVMIVEQTQAQGDASTELESERIMAGTMSSDIGIQALIMKPARKILRLLGFAGAGRTDIAEGSDVNVITSKMQNDFTGEGQTKRSGSFSGVITCRVIGVQPGGILHIKGRRWVVINHDAQFLSIEGLVRPEDLSIRNTVASNFIAEMNLSYDGLGVIDDKQRPGWLARVFDWVYPL